MIDSPIQFEVNDNTYTACYVGQRDGKPANRWYCALFNIFVEAPASAIEANVISEFMAAATAVEEVPADAD